MAIPHQIEGVGCEMALGPPFFLCFSGFCIDGFHNYGPVTENIEFSPINDVLQKTLVSGFCVRLLFNFRSKNSMNIFTRLPLFDVNLPFRCRRNCLLRSPV